MDVLFLQMLFHVRKIHPPDAVFVLHQRGMHGLVAVVLQAHGETDVGGAVDQDLVAAGADAVQRTDDAAQHTVLVADVFRLQAGDAVALLMPPDDAVEIRIRGLKIAEGRVFCTLNDGFLDGGHGGEIHVGHPHRDGVKALLRGSRMQPPAGKLIKSCGKITNFYDEKEPSGPEVNHKSQTKIRNIAIFKMKALFGAIRHKQGTF